MVQEGFESSRKEGPKRKLKPMAAITAASFGDAHIATLRESLEENLPNEVE